MTEGNREVQVYDRSMTVAPLDIDFCGKSHCGGRVTRPRIDRSRAQAKGGAGSYRHRMKRFRTLGVRENDLYTTLENLSPQLRLVTDRG